ncbi:MAG: Hpt domain-containing protein [Oscillospiraceae bacterium]
MDKIIEKLKEYGADVDGAMRRFLDDEELYKSCFVIFLEDKAFLKLEEALAVEDYEKAFECAHTLKGVAGNMGLNPIYKVICDMVEALRSKEYSGLQSFNRELLRQLELLKQL